MSSSTELLLKRADQLRKAAIRLEKQAQQVDLRESLGRGSKGAPFKVFDYAKAREMLARGCTERETAAAVGIHWNTLHCWKHRLKWTSPSLETLRAAAQELINNQVPHVDRETDTYESAVNRIARILWVVTRESRFRDESGQIAVSE